MFLKDKLSTAKCIYLVCTALLLCISFKSQASNKAIKGNVSDTSARAKDSLKRAKAKTDSIAKLTSPSGLKSEVKYNAKDSIVFDLDNKQASLYSKADSKEGKSHVEYTDIKLDASYVRIDYLTNIIFAKGGLDSSGKMTAKPIFTQGKDKSYSDSINYDYKTKKGKIYNLFTNEGEGYIHVQEAKMVKIDGKDVIYAKNAKYTTCNLPDDPHFYIEAGKMKLMPNDKVVTGPAYIVIEDVPVPVILPFGFFPAGSHKTSGIILPSYGESATQGFGLLGGGFYYGGSDHYDATIKADIYTGGSYKLDLSSRYKTLYEYNGNFDISYARNQIGLVETPQYTVQENYALNWQHAQDPKANPGTSFSASVNAATPSFFTKNSYNLAELTNQTLNSSINYSKQFLNTPFNLSVAATNDENLGLKTINFALPDATLTMNRINPFKVSTETKKHWYDEINVSYTMRVLNHLASYDSTIKNDITDLTKYRSGIDQEIPISASFKVMKYFTLTPTINNSVYIYTKKFTYDYKTYYNPLRQRDTSQTVENVYSGFFLAHTHSVSAQLSTTVYGMYRINRGKFLAFRHVLTPSVTAVYSPDYSAPIYGYYGSYVSDAYGTVKKYAYYSDATSVIGSPAQGPQGSLQFSLQNNFELKVKTQTKKDSAASTKKIKILDYLNFSSSYNFLLDSMKLAPLSIQTAATPIKNFNVQASAVLDPYYYDKYGNEHKEYAINENNTIGRITSANLTLGTSLNSKAQNSKNKPIEQVRNPFVQYNYPAQYASFDVPWDIRLNYTANYNGLYRIYYDNEFFLNHQLTHNFTVNGDVTLTKNWKVTYATGYDLTTQKPTVSQITVYRDLHCWAMSFQWIPFGTFRSYFFNIHIKASALQDVKINKQKQYYDF